METLFTQQLKVNGKDTLYNVSFHDDAYHFTPQAKGGISFSIKRERDEWMTNNDLDPSLLSAATAGLDNYLLSQH